MLLSDTKVLSYFVLMDPAISIMKLLGLVKIYIVTLLQSNAKLLNIIRSNLLTNKAFRGLIKTLLVDK